MIECVKNQYQPLDLTDKTQKARTERLSEMDSTEKTTKPKTERLTELTKNVKKSKADRLDSTSDDK